MATLTSVFTNIYRLGLINWFYYPLVFQTQPAQIYRDARPGYFSSNELIDVVFYIIFAAVGWGIFAALVFSVGLFVKKNVLFYVVGPSIAIALILYLLGTIALVTTWYKRKRKLG